MGVSDPADKPAPEPPAAHERPAEAGWIGVLGLHIDEVSAERVLARWDVGPRHLQPFGIVHGGVYASVVETCCSLGALSAAAEGLAVVGVENHTSFLRPASAGRLYARAAPLHAGRRAQLWECNIFDGSDRLIATGRVRLMCVEAEQKKR